MIPRGKIYGRIGRAACALLALLSMSGCTWLVPPYRHDLAAARERIGSGSQVVETRCGPIEYAVRGEGPPLLVVHGAGGGFDQGLMIAAPLSGYRVIAVSRFGYLRT
ncbi:MAG TPA: alpha/beta hydrolase, partial [Gammaproteobacteria bacterium]